jgi:pilus assembly protein CpaE
MELAKSQKPDVVLMDINMPDMDGITATELIRQQNPLIQVIILSVQNDQSYMRRAMLVGARDFLVKPPAPDELTSAIRRAGRMAHEEQSKSISYKEMLGGAFLPGTGPLVNGKVVVVYSPKGGAGTTTLAVNLAVVLQNNDTSVVIVDGNLQYGDVAIFLNEQVHNSIRELASRSEELDPEVVRDVLITHKTSGVKLLPAPPKPEYADDISGDQFRKILKYLRMMFSYIIVDASSALNDVVLAAFDESDVVVLITTQDIPAIKNTRLFLDLAGVLEIERNRIIFVMNRFDKRIGITTEKIGENLKCEFSNVIPLEEKIIIPSVNRGVPFMLGDRTRPIARSILSLAENVRQKISHQSAELSDALPITPIK